jgi:alpha-amylase
MTLGPFGRRFRIVALPMLAALSTACSESASTIVGVNGIAADLTITVQDADMGAGSGALALDVGESASLAAVATNALGLAVGGVVPTWSSSDYAVVEVSQAGVVTAVAAGSATVYASAGGVSAGLTVVVTQPETVPPPAP